MAAYALTYNSQYLKNERIIIKLGDMNHQSNTKEELVPDLNKFQKEISLSDICFQNLFNHSSSGMAICSIIRDHDCIAHDFVHLQFNKASQEHTELETLMLVGKPASELIPPKDVLHLVHIYGQVVDSGKPSSLEQYFSIYDKTMFLTVVHLKGDLFVLEFNDPTRCQKTELALSKHLNCMDRVNNALQKATDLDQMMLDLLNTVLDIFNVDRAWLLYPCDPEAESWSIPMERTKPGFPGAFEIAEKIPMRTEDADVFREMQHSKEVHTYDYTKETTIPETIEQFSVLNQMIMAIQPPTDKAWLFGVHQCSNYYEWTQEDKDLFLEIGRRLSDAFHRLMFFKDLKESEEQFRYVLNNSVSVIYNFNLQTATFDYGSPSTMEVYGYPPHFFISGGIREVFKHFHPEDLPRMKTYAKNIIDNKLNPFRTSVEYRFKHPKLGYRWINDTRTLIYNDAGHPVSIIGNSHDITERKQAEETLIKAKVKAEESDRLKSAFLTNISHEIRTPMNGIIGFAELLKEPKLTEEEQQSYISIITESGERLLNTINDLMDISKIESGQMKLLISEININEQLECISIFFKPDLERKGLQLVFSNQLSPNDVMIKTDKEKIRAILTNLVRNAIKYSNTGSIELGCKKENNLLEFYVKDKGIGISKDRQKIIFERFVQAEMTNRRTYEGVGLGLSITKAYIEMLGGKIWLESEVGKGSVFYFNIPINIAHKETKIEADFQEKAKVKHPLKKLKTLIVEDDEASDILISIGVNAFSKEILKAKSGLEAVEICRNNPDLDLVLMDIEMPHMNGYEATQQIREFNKDVIILAQTAYGMQEDREMALNMGCNDYISKPFNLPLLVEVIKKHFS